MFGKWKSAVVCRCTTFLPEGWKHSIPTNYTRKHQLIDAPRFHAWQSALLFAFLFVIHVIFSWSSVLSWIIFSADIVLIGWLTFRAYRDGMLLCSSPHVNFQHAADPGTAETLDRYEVPVFGPLASSILDDE
jgi:uncharacterized membrane protein